MVSIAASGWDQNQPLRTGELGFKASHWISSGSRTKLEWRPTPQPGTSELPRRRKNLLRDFIFKAFHNAKLEQGQEKPEWWGEELRPWRLSRSRNGDRLVRRYGWSFQAHTGRPLAWVMEDQTGLGFPRACRPTWKILQTGLGRKVHPWDYSNRCLRHENYRPGSAKTAFSLTLKHALRNLVASSHRQGSLGLNPLQLGRGSHARTWTRNFSTHSGKYYLPEHPDGF